MQKKDNSILTDLQFRKFSPDDFAEYQRWFQFDAVSKYLGPTPDECWLDHILHDNEGTQLSVFSETQLVAVIGIHFATKRHPTQVITDFAVDPESLRCGIGSQALALVLSGFELPSGVTWQTFIDQENQAAIAFFSKNNWEQIRHPDENNMLTFEQMPT